MCQYFYNLSSELIGVRDVLYVSTKEVMRLTTLKIA